MASITFTPTGSQLDNDEIADIQLNPGDRISTSFELDTSDLDASLQFLEVQVDQDFAEVEVISVRTDFDRSTFPDFNLVATSNNDNFTSAVFERTGDPGADPNTVNVIVEGEITALEGLNNDGQSDFGITVIEAIDINGQDVTALFEPANNAIEVQPVAIPEVSIEVEPIFVIEGGEIQAFTYKLSEPAPPGGLVVDTLVTDPDLQVDTIPNLEQTQNVANAEVRDEDGRNLAILTIAEGAMGAIISFDAVEDDVAEGNELFSLTLLPGDGYTVDPDNDSVNGVVIDADIVINGTQSDDLLDGTDDTDAILGDDGSDIISGKGNNDALFGGNGSDRLFGDAGDDLVFGDNGRDRLFGGDGSDTLDGSLGKDTLIGGAGNDLLEGGENQDRLIGVELNSDEPGLNERDTLTGGVGADMFVLGNEAGIFYSDGDSFASGDGDFALISDLNLLEDAIQLFGFSEQYTLDFLPNSTGNFDAKLIYDSGLDSGSELIAVMENVSPDLNIEDSVFTFV